MRPTTTAASYAYTDGSYAELSDGDDASDVAAAIAPLDPSHHSSVVEYTQWGPRRTAQRRSRADAKPERSREVETLQEAVHDLHERSLLCVGKLEAVMVPLRDNEHQQSPSTLLDRPNTHNDDIDDGDDDEGGGSRASSIGSTESGLGGGVAAATHLSLRTSLMSAASSMPDFAVLDDKRFNESVTLHLVRFHTLGSPDTETPDHTEKGRPDVSSEPPAAESAEATRNGGGANLGRPSVATASGADEHRAVARCELDEFLRSLPRDNTSDRGLSWLHVNHAETLRRLATHLKCHPLMLKTFFDTRPQTTVNHLDCDTVLLTSVSVFLEAAELHTHKLCVYATPHLVITFERELLTRTRAYLDTELSKDKVFLEVQRALVLDDRGNAALFNNGSAAINDASSAFSLGGGADDGPKHAGVAPPPPPTSALRALMDELGGGFLAYLLLMEMSALGQSTLDLYADAIRALHRQVHNEFSAQHRVDYFRSINILHHGLEILSAHYEQATALGLRALGDSSGGGGGGVDSNFRESGGSDALQDLGGGGFSGGDCSGGGFSGGGLSGLLGRGEDGESDWPFGWVDEQRRKHGASGSGYGSRNKGIVGREGHASLSSSGGVAVRRRPGRDGLDFYAAQSRCVTAAHLPYFRDVEDVASAGLRKLAGHEAALGELRTTLRDQVRTTLRAKRCRGRLLGAPFSVREDTPHHHGKRCI
jgi:hypothetical protein